VLLLIYGGGLPSRAVGSETEFFIDSTGQKPLRHHQTDAEKMSSILNLFTKFRWSIGKFLWLLFDEKSNLGGSAVKSFLDGTSDVRAGHIINAMYSHQYSHPPSRHHEQLHQFSPDITPSNIKYAGPAISSWALQLILDITKQEGIIYAQERLIYEYVPVDKQIMARWV